MKYYAEVGGRTVEVEIEERGGGFVVSIAGRKIAADLRQIHGLTLYSLLLDQRSHEVSVEQREHAFVVTIAGERYLVKVQDERARRLSEVVPRAMGHEGETVIKAPMPGLVVSLDVAPGDVVKKGKGLLVLEAMKMENEMRSPRDGTIKAIYVRKGDRVEHGRDLIVIV
mgnify:CR=1 FL=1